jgi:glucosamine 6-phosphate synthetase-like amidotransferase/phosphosugar isomerase protein
MIEDIVKKQAVVVVYSDIPCDLEGIINICYGKSLNPISRGIPFILIPQLINYYKSAFTGADPDKPEGLDPWIKL